MSWEGAVKLAARATVSEGLTGAGAAASELVTRSLCFSPHGPPHRAAADKVSRASAPRVCKKAKAQTDAAVPSVSERW